MNLLTVKWAVMAWFLFVVLSTKTAFVASTTSGSLAWPTPSGFETVKEGQFKTYIEMRRVNEQGTNYWVLYRCTLDKNAFAIAKGVEGRRGENRVFWQYDNDFLIEIQDLGVYTVSLNRDNRQKLTSVSTAMPEYFFILKNYLFVSAENIYDLKKLIANPNDTTALLSYDDINLFRSKSWKEDIQSDCFDSTFYCAPNYDNPEDMLFTAEKSILLLKGVMYYIECGGSDGKAFNQRCHYYLKNIGSGKSWYFPQTLKVSSDELKGDRTMLFPLIDKNDKFFADMASSSDQFSPKFSFYQLNILNALLWAALNA